MLPFLSVTKKCCGMLHHAMLVRCSAFVILFFHVLRIGKKVSMQNVSIYTVWMMIINKVLFYIQQQQQ